MDSFLAPNGDQVLGWQFQVMYFLVGLLDATAFIFGGLVGYFAGAGPRSFWVSLAFILVVPLALIVLVTRFLSDSYGLMPPDTLFGIHWNAIIASYLGSMCAMLLSFFLLRRARIVFRGLMQAVEGAR